MVNSVLITGGNGFIGKKLIKFLHYKKKINHIRVIDNLSSSKLSVSSDFNIVKDIKNLNSKKKGIFFFKKNILNKKHLEIFSKNVDAIIHLAANAGVEKSISDPLYDLRNNAQGTLNVLDSAKNNKIKKIIIASSNAVVGKSNVSITENSITKPSNFYGLSKLTSEHYARIYYELFNLQTVCLRFGNVYGPGSYAKTSVIPKFIKNIINGKKCNINGDGKQTRDFIYIDDLISSIFQSLKINKIGGEIFQISTGKKTSINELSKLIYKNFKKFRINNVNFQFSRKRKGDVKANFSNISKAKKILKWKPLMTLDKGISDTIEYFLNEKKN